MNVADAEQQAFELADTLESLRLRYPDIPPELGAQMAGLIEELRQARVGRLAGQAMVIIGETHDAIRQHQDDTDSRVADVQEDITEVQVEQDLAAQRVRTITDAIAGLVELHTDRRLKALEARETRRNEQLRYIEDQLAHLLRGKTQRVEEATAPRTG